MRICTTTCMVAMAAVVMMAHHAMADLVILRADGTHASSSQATREYNPDTGGWNITLNSLYAPGGVTAYTIRANGGETIDNLWIDVPCWKNFEGECIPAGSPVFVRLYSDAPNGLRYIHNIEQTGTAETLLMHAEATRDIGQVSVLTIGTLHAGRDIVGPITATTLDNQYRGVETVIAGRDVRGDIIANRGRIVNIEAGNNIGSAFDPITVRSKFGQMEVHAEHAMHATITAGANGGSGYLARLSCDAWHGTINTPRFGGLVRSGRMRIRESFNGSMYIGGSLSDHVDYFVLPVQGISGQIIINADNQPGGTWDVPIHLGPEDDPETVVVYGPLYELPSDALGGGSIGVVPFRLHDQSCTPPNGSTITLAPGQSIPPIALEHYGPVTWSFGSPLTIERRPIGAESPYQLVATSDVQMYRSSNNPTRVIVENAPGKSGLQPGYEYRIKPTTQLRCELDSLPPVQWQSDYLFTIELPNCQGDLNGDGVVNVTDLLLMLAFWGPVGALPAADLNGDGVVNVSDLLILLSNWGTCTSAQESSVSQPQRGQNMDAKPAPRATHR